MKYKPYNVIGFSGDSFVSYAIKRFTNSKWSHCGIVYEEADDYIILAEAVSNGFILRKHKKKSLDKKLAKKKIRVREIPNDIGLRYPKIVIDSHLGTKYGHFQIFLNAVSLFFKKELKGDKDKTLTCSEAVAVCLKEMTRGRIDIAKEFNTTQDFVYPSHVMESSELKTK